MCVHSCAISEYSMSKTTWHTVYCVSEHLGSGIMSVHWFSFFQPTVVIPLSQQMVTLVPTKAQLREQRFGLDVTQGLSQLGIWQQYVHQMEVGHQTQPLLCAHVSLPTVACSRESLVEGIGSRLQFVYILVPFQNTVCPKQPDTRFCIDQVQITCPLYRIAVCLHFRGYNVWVVMGNIC